MEFRLDAGQVELQQTVARFCADRFPLDSIADREGAPIDRAGWREMAELGVFGLLVDGAAGSSGLGVVEGALLFEQLGSHLVPGPVLWSVLAAPLLDGVGGGVATGGLGGLAEGVATGEQVVGGIDAGGLGVDSADVVVEHAADIDVLVVIGDGGVVAHRTADLDPPAALEPLDPLTPVGRFADLPGGVPVGGAAAAARLRLLGTVLSAALLAGIAARALEVARSHALERRQFGAPIGSFQAVKHLLADMYVRGSLAQSATYAAAAVAQEPGGDDPARAAAGAKLLATEAAIANAGTAVQVLGGMGFTWDMLPHRLLKRAWVLEQGFGAADDHAFHLGSTLAAAAS